MSSDERHTKDRPPRDQRDQGRSGREAREARLAEALRANLRRRKAGDRARRPEDEA